MKSISISGWTKIVALALAPLLVWGLCQCLVLKAEAGELTGKRLLAGRKKEAAEADPMVVLETTRGQITVQVFKNEAPITAGNFMDLVNRGFYNGLSFHRYVPGFVIQGGDPTGTGRGGFIDPKTNQERTIPLETKPRLRHDAAGMLAMARSNEPDSASSQFYITLKPSSFLDGKYAVFGKVVDGLNVVMQLRADDKMTKVYELTKEK